MTYMYRYVMSSFLVPLLLSLSRSWACHALLPSGDAGTEQQGVAQPCRRVAILVCFSKRHPFSIQSCWHCRGIAFRPFFATFGHRIRGYKLFEIRFWAILKAFFAPKTKIRGYKLFQKSQKKRSDSPHPPKRTAPRLEAGVLEDARFEAWHARPAHPLAVEVFL